MRFRHDIEGLRAVAVAVVIAYHAQVPGFTGGFVGVDVFFVVSGFLITGLLLRDTDHSPWHRLRHFYARRVRRIVPAATLVILLTLAFAAAWQNPLLQRTAQHDATAAMFFFSNIRFHVLATDYFNRGAAPSLFQHYWSLSVEEQFYIVWPALLIATSVFAAARRRAHLGIVVALLGAVSFVVGWRLTTTNPTFAFFLLPARAWELCSGALVALAATRVRMTPGASSVARAVGIGLIVAAVFGFDDGTAFPGAAALVPVAGAALVIAAGIPSREHEGRALTVVPLQLGGRYSYSLYLWHWPALMLAGLQRPSVLTDWRAALVVVALVVIPGAVASYHLVEHPFRATFNRRPDAQSLLAGAALVAVFALALVPYGATAGEIDSGRRVAAGPVTPANATDFVPSNLDPPLSGPPPVTGKLCVRTGVSCVTGDATATRAIVLYGDSHANHWVLTFGAFGRQHGWRVEVIGSAGCRSFVEPPSRFGQNCDEFRARANTRIAELRPALVVFSNQSSEFYGRDPKAWAAGIGTALDALPTGVRAAVLSQTPMARHRVPECLADHLDDTRPCEPSRQSFGTINHALRRAVRAHGSAFVDLTAWFCEESRCPVIMGGVLVYRDRSHVTAAFTRTRAGALATALAPLVGD